MTEPQVELMYRAPNRDEHQTLVEILDEIMHSLNNINNRLEKLENETVR